MNIGLIFNEVLVRPIINVLLVIYHGLLLAHIPYALGFSIILLTVVIRFILYPFINSQMKASRKMQELSPHLSNLKEKHKGDTKKIHEETMKLYKEHGVNPAAGCLPMFIQLPIIWALYSVLQQVVALNSSSVVAHINKLVYVPGLKLAAPWDQHFFGIALGQNPSHLFSTMPFILGVPVLTGVLQYVQTRMMTPQKKALVVKKGKEAKEKQDSAADFASAFQTQSLYIFPLMIGFFSYNFPIGISLYWNTFTLFGILQQYKILKS